MANFRNCVRIRCWPPSSRAVKTEAAKADRNAVRTPPLPKISIVLNLDNSIDRKILAMYDHIRAYCAIVMT